jgi:hypothetical protein
MSFLPVAEPRFQARSDRRLPSRTMRLPTLPSVVVFAAAGSSPATAWRCPLARGVCGRRFLSSTSWRSGRRLRRRVGYRSGDIGGRESHRGRLAVPTTAGDPAHWSHEMWFEFACQETPLETRGQGRTPTATDPSPMDDRLILIVPITRLAIAKPPLRPRHPAAPEAPLTPATPGRAKFAAGARAAAGAGLSEARANAVKLRKEG